MRDSWSCVSGSATCCLDIKQRSAAQIEWDRRREFLLQQIDDWETGRKSSIGRPMNSERYAREMCENRKRLEVELRAIGGYGSDRSGRPTK